MFKKALAVATLAATFLCGCNPDETNVTVKASALKAATEGKVATAKVDMRIEAPIPLESDIPEKVRRAALPFLGENGTIRAESHKKDSKANESKAPKPGSKEVPPKTRFLASFDIPVGTHEALQKAPHGILQLEYDPKDKTFRLVYGRGMPALNSALTAIDENCRLDYTGGYIRGFIFGSYKTTIRIQNDDKITIGVAAVNVNGDAIIAGSVDTDQNSLTIDYGNKFYAGKAPCFMYGGFQSMSSWSPERGK